MHEDHDWETLSPGQRRQRQRSQALWMRTFYFTRTPGHMEQCRAYLTRGVSEYFRAHQCSYVTVQIRRDDDGLPRSLRLVGQIDNSSGTALSVRSDRTIQGGVFSQIGMPAMRVDLREERPGVLLGDLDGVDPRQWGQP